MIKLSIVPPPRLPLINEAITCRRCFRTWAVVRIDDSEPPRAPQLTCMTSRQWPPSWVTPWCAACCPDAESFARGMSFESFDIPAESSPPLPAEHERILEAAETLIEVLGASAVNLATWLEDEHRFDLFGYDEEGARNGQSAALAYGFLSGAAAASGVTIRSLIESHRLHAAVLARARERAKERALETEGDGS